MIVFILAYLLIYLDTVKYEEKIKVRKRPPQQKTPTKKLVGANCITWCAKTGEVLEEKII